MADLHSRLAGSSFYRQDIRQTGRLCVSIKHHNLSPLKSSPYLPIPYTFTRNQSSASVQTLLLNAHFNFF